jgi:hypothetical protein
MPRYLNACLVLGMTLLGVTSCWERLPISLSKSKSDQSAHAQLALTDVASRVLTLKLLADVPIGLTPKSLVEISLYDENLNELVGGISHKPTAIPGEIKLQVKLDEATAGKVKALAVHLDLNRDAKIFDAGDFFGFAPVADITKTISVNLKQDNASQQGPQPSCVYGGTSYSQNESISRIRYLQETVTESGECQSEIQMATCKEGQLQWNGSYAFDSCSKVESTVQTPAPDATPAIPANNSPSESNSPSQNRGTPAQNK